jgi:hypothetical protein
MRLVDVLLSDFRGSGCRSFLLQHGFAVYRLGS